MNNYIKDKVIIITGAGSGFGKMTSEKAAEMGGKIICADVNEESVQGTVKGIQKKGFEARHIAVDVSKKDQVDAMAKLALDSYERIDVLVNNAGTMPLSTFAEHENAWKAWDQCIDIAIKGALYGISAVYDQMIKQGQGHVVGVSSIYDGAPVINAGAYQVSKIGVRYLMETLRQEAQGAIKTTVIKPSAVVSTGLMSTVINPEGGKGLYAQNWDEGAQRAAKEKENQLPPEYSDINSAKYWRLHPEAIVDNIIYCMNQPWGISISDITVRTTGEIYIL